MTKVIREIIGVAIGSDPRAHREQGSARAEESPLRLSVFGGHGRYPVAASPGSNSRNKASKSSRRSFRRRTLLFRPWLREKPTWARPPGIAVVKAVESGMNVRIIGEQVRNGMAVGYAGVA